MLTTRGMLPASDVDIERAVTADCRKGIADTRIRIMVSGEGLGLLDGEKLMSSSAARPTGARRLQRKRREEQRSDETHLQKRASAC